MPIKKALVVCEYTFTFGSLINLNGIFFLEKENISYLIIERSLYVFIVRKIV